MLTQALSNRLLSLKEAIYQVYDRLISDDILQMLSNTPLSQSHIPERVQEIFSEVIENDREAYIEILLEDIEKMRLEQTELVDKVQVLMKEKGRKDIEIKRLNDRIEDGQKTFKKFEMENIENQRKINDLIIVLEERDKDLMRLNAESSSAKARLIEKETLLEHRGGEIEGLAETKENLQKALKDLGNREYGNQSKLLELEGIVNSFKGKYTESQEKYEKLYKKMEAMEKIQQEELENQKKQLINDFESHLKIKDEDIENFKIAVDELNRNYEQKTKDLRMKNHKIKEKNKVFETTLREYEHILKENQEFHESFEGKAEEYERLLKEMDDKNIEMKEKYENEIKELKKNHIEIIEKTEKTYEKALNNKGVEILEREISMIKQEKHALEDRLHIMESNYKELQCKRNEENNEFMNKIQDKEQFIKNLKENLEKLSLENGLFVQANKDLELSVWSVKRVKEAKELDYQSILKERNIVIETLEANIRHFKENEGFLKKKIDVLENREEKRLLDIENDKKKTTFEIENERKRFNEENDRKRTEIILKEKRFQDDIKILQEEIDVFKGAEREKLREIDRFKGDIEDKEDEIKRFKAQQENNMKTMKKLEEKIQNMEIETKIREKDIENRLFENFNKEIENLKKTSIFEKQEFEIVIENLQKELKKTYFDNKNLKAKFKENKDKFKRISSQILEESKKNLILLKESFLNNIKEISYISEENLRNLKDYIREIYERKVVFLARKHAEDIKQVEIQKSQEFHQFEKNLLDTKVFPIEKLLKEIQQYVKVLENTLNTNEIDKGKLEDIIRETHEKLILKTQEYDENSKKYQEIIENLSFFEKTAKDLKEKNTIKDQEILKKSQEISLLAGFLMKLKDEIVVIMELEKDRKGKFYRNTLKEIKGINEYIRNLQKTYIESLEGIRKELDRINDERNKEIEVLREKNGHFRKEIGEKSVEISKKSEEIIYQAEKINQLELRIDDLADDILEKTTLLTQSQRQLETFPEDFAKKRAFISKTEANFQNIQDTQRKIHALEDEIKVKNRDFSLIKQENDRFKQTIEDLQYQLSLKTKNYDKLREENFKENKKNNEELLVWKKIIAIKSESSLNKQSSFHKKDVKNTNLDNNNNKMSKQVKDLLALDKSFNF